MLGWIVIFASIALLGAIFTFAAGTGYGPVSFRCATVVFSALLFACIATHIGRRHI